MPPPPAAALSMTGKPISSAIRRASSGSATGSTVPGTTGAPASRTARRALVFEPINSMASGGGPTSVSPASRTMRANAADSERNP